MRSCEDEMQPVQELPPTLRFSTAQLPERDRFNLYREMFGRGVVNIDMTPLSENSWAAAELRALSGASIMWGSNSACRFEKARGGALASDDILLIWTRDATHGVFSHLGKEIPVDTGTTVVMSCEHHAVAVNALPISHVNLKVQRASLAALAPRIDDALMRPLRSDIPAMRLLKSYVGTMRTMSPDAALEHMAVLHICDLIALCVGAASDVTEQASQRGLRVARLDAIRKFVLANLGDPALSVRHAARSQAVTPRYVQMLFEEAETTFSRFLLEQRLALVHRQLSNAFLERPIGLIALDAGFADISYFNQAFRRQYGETPSDVRNRSLTSAAAQP